MTYWGFLEDQKMFKRILLPIWEGVKGALLVFPAYLVLTETVADVAFVSGSSMQVWATPIHPTP